MSAHILMPEVGGRKIVSFCTRCKEPIYEGERAIAGMHERCCDKPLSGRAGYG